MGIFDCMPDIHPAAGQDAPTLRHACVAGGSYSRGGGDRGGGDRDRGGYGRGPPQQDYSSAGYGAPQAGTGYYEPDAYQQQAPPQQAGGYDQGGGAGGGPPRPKEAREGDWACPGCSNTNFAFRSAEWPRHMVLYARMTWLVAAYMRSR